MNHRKTMNNSIDFIEKHLNEKLTAEEIAANAGYSVYYFSRLFKEYTGKSVMTFVRDRRMELAREQFDESRVCDVAERFGYESTSGFSRAYKRCFGECPCGSRMNA